MMLFFPEIISGSAGIGILLMELCGYRISNKKLGWLAVFTLLLGMFFHGTILGERGNLSSVFFAENQFLFPLQTGFKLAIQMIALLTLLPLLWRLENTVAWNGLFYAFLLIGVAAGSLAISSKNLIFTWLNLELVFLVIILLPILSGKSKEGSLLKYRWLGYKTMISFCFLIGVFFLSHTTGTVELDQISQNKLVVESNSFVLVGILLILIAIFTSLGFFPFHFWILELYEVSSSVLTFFMISLLQLVWIGTFSSIILYSFPNIISKWNLLFQVLAGGTLLLGAVPLLFSSNLASIVPHLSLYYGAFTFLTLLYFPGIDSAIPMITIFSYTLAVFGYAAALAMPTTPYTLKIEDLTGLGRQKPFEAFVILFFYGSLAGIPLTGGFISKFLFLRTLVFQEHYYLAGILLFTTSILFYVFFKMGIVIFSVPSQYNAALEFKNPTAKVGILLAIAGSLLLGIYPMPIFNWF